MTESTHAPFPALRDFFSRVRALRHLSVENIEMHLGVEPGSLADVLAGRRMPAPLEVKGLAIVLQCEDAAILEAVGTYNPSEDVLRASAIPRDRPDHPYHKLPESARKRMDAWSHLEAYGVTKIR